MKILKNLYIVAMLVVIILVVSFVYSDSQLTGNIVVSSDKVKEIIISGTEFSFSPSSITVNKGDKVKLTFKNVGDVIHDFTIDELGVKTRILESGESQTIEFTADKSGTFNFYCSVPGHKEAGMEGELGVESVKDSVDISNINNVVPIRSVGNFYKFTDQPITSDNKAYIQYTGADFCPFCAAERWAIVNALNRFGEFEKITENFKSASFNEPWINLPTYSFTGASYKSDYLDFSHKEFADRNFQPLEDLSPQEEEIFNKFNPRGSIPFFLIGGKRGVFVQVGAGYSPSLLDGKTFDEIKISLEKGEKTALTKAIMEEAERITALICFNNGKQPADVCNTSEVSSIISQLGG